MPAQIFVQYIDIFGSFKAPGTYDLGLEDSIDPRGASDM
jgi:hypothetical protein